ICGHAPATEATEATEAGPADVALAAPLPFGLSRSFKSQCGAPTPASIPLLIVLRTAGSPSSATNPQASEASYREPSTANFPIQLRAIIVPMQKLAALSSLLRPPRGVAASLSAALFSAASA